MSFQNPQLQSVTILFKIVHPCLLLYRLFMHSPLFFRKIVEIDHFVLRAAVLHEYQNYLEGRGLFGRKPPSP